MTILNILGLCINIAGALVIFFNSPVINYNTFLYNKSETAAAPISSINEFLLVHVLP